VVVQTQRYKTGNSGSWGGVEGTNTKGDAKNQGENALFTPVWIREKDKKFPGGANQRKGGDELGYYSMKTRWICVGVDS